VNAVTANARPAAIGFRVRARPFLGTLVEIGADRPEAIARGFDAVAALHAAWSRFEPTSEIARFNAAAAGAAIEVGAASCTVLRAAARLQAASAGAFDITLGRAPAAWRLEGGRLCKLEAGAQIDLGGIGKGAAVDAAVDALVYSGCAGGWVNAGGDLRVFGDCTLALALRDERTGALRPFGRLREGACATSRYGRGERSALAGAAAKVDAHLSVLAPRCLWADALTKLAALGRDDLLDAFDARVWRH
jgi:thiamine biosynthesis lipoprotein